MNTTLSASDRPDGPPSDERNMDISMGCQKFVECFVRNDPRATKALPFRQHKGWYEVRRRNPSKRRLIDPIDFRKSSPDIKKGSEPPGRPPSTAQQARKKRHLSVLKRPNRTSPLPYGRLPESPASIIALRE
ncbi:hypothetical protein SISSUDRAFT_1055821 [Sistotremastrum suecicum HHB10207 ss-3]|uniref:Uncharacterized protein n=1 Tax=Sistotremastrum suecicum HHB10207 ss-3 TaxID=1314776 RepID=A0A165XIE8_9AGAM|nr:hypothetical protein SISSUDRAFT_1055821 [Sistotremastrum suecicum HHB10207 ss-3]